MKNYQQLKVWQSGFQIALASYRLTQTFPREEKFGLISQMNAAAVSIPSNIAEGSSRSSQKEYSRFIEISLGSCYELQTQTLLATHLNFGDRVLRSDLSHLLEEEGRMLYGFLNHLKSC